MTSTEGARAAAGALVEVFADELARRAALEAEADGSSLVEESHLETVCVDSMLWPKRERGVPQRGKK